MGIVIHDLDNKQFQTLFPEINKDMYIISDSGSIRNCIGCFGCWIKTPGQCVIKDSYDNMGELLSQADTVIIISKCCYGGYSPFVKNVLERSISYQLPFFKTKNKETHHKPRYKNNLKFRVYFYGEHISPQEMDTAKSLIKANAVNFHVSDYEISFCKSPSQLCRREINYED